MAKFKEKIESEQLLKNDLGWKILRKLLDDGVLELKGKFYFLKPEAVHKFLGISWIDLRMGQTDPQLIEYLNSIN